MIVQFSSIGRKSKKIKNIKKYSCNYWEKNENGGQNSIIQKYGMAVQGEESVNGKAVSDDIEASYEYIKEEEC